MVQQLKFGTIAILDLHNMINGLDHDVGAHFYQKMKKAWWALMHYSTAKPRLGIPSHTWGVKKCLHFFTTNTPNAHVIYTPRVNLINKHDMCVTVAHEVHLHM